CQGQTINSFSKKLTNMFSSSLISTEHGLAPGDSPGPEGEAVDGPASFHRHCDVTAAHLASSTLVERLADATTRLHSSTWVRKRLTSFQRRCQRRWTGEENADKRGLGER